MQAEILRQVAQTTAQFKADFQVIAEEAVKRAINYSLPNDKVITSLTDRIDQLNSVVKKSDDKVIQITMNQVRPILDTIHNQGNKLQQHTQYIDQLEADKKEQ